jgi:hypothetical protein
VCDNELCVSMCVCVCVRERERERERGGREERALPDAHLQYIIYEHTLQYIRYLFDEDSHRIYASTMIPVPGVRSYGRRAAQKFPIF